MEYPQPVLETQICSLRFCKTLEDYCNEKTFIDVGSNMGAATYLLSSFADSVIAIEPNKELVKLIESQCKERKIDYKVTILECAASNKSGEINIYISPIDTGLSSAFEENLSTRHLIGLGHEIHYEKRRVKAIAIDDLDLHDVGAIKIDVEGFEGNVIRGSLKTIARCKPAILWERSIGLPKTTNNVVEELLERFGYEHTVVNSIPGIHDDVLSTPT